MIPAIACLVAAGLLLGGAAEAGQVAAPVGSRPATDTGAAPAAPAVDGPPAPVPPAVVSRDAAGRTTIRAIRLDAPLRLDGTLDELLYETVPPVSDFVQTEPRLGEPATERTDIWVSYDRNNVYVSARCWDTQMDRLIATEMRRDNSNIFTGNDVIAFTFDTFYDRRNATQFIVNPIGGRQDGQVANESQYNGDFNLIWDVKVGRFDGGWTMEAAIPFKSLRYRSGTTQIWGFNVMRLKRSKNEISFITRMTAQRGGQTLHQISGAATVVGIEAPPFPRKLDVKPYATSSVTSDANATPRLSNDLTADAGLDLKYGLTDGITADFTYNTDFAHVEADEQQVNLTRFSLFFPEKREFFLENQGTFSFGGVAATGTAGSGDTPILFYGRRIGLNQGRLVPLQAGGRVTGRVGRYTFGFADMQSGDEPVSESRSTNFSVVRLKRDLLRRSSIGVIYTGRSVAQNGSGANRAYGFDATFGFYDHLALNAYWARTKSDGLRGEDTSYRGQLDYAGDRYGVQLERLTVGANFNPDVGFVRRYDLRRSFGLFRFSPRPNAKRPVSRLIRKFSYTGSVSQIENGGGRLETRERGGEFATEFQNSDRFSVAYTNLYEFLPGPFRIASGVTLPVGGYDFDNLEVGFNLGQRRRISANLLGEYGTFYNGHRTAFTASRSLMRITTQLSVAPTYSINRVDLVQGSFTTHLAGSRVIYTMTPLMFASALVQYSTATNVVSANARLRWEYRPGSELFIVFNEERKTLVPGFPNLSNRAFIVKVNRLFRF